MTRLVLIHVELGKNYQVVTGNSLIEIVLGKTVARKNVGFSKLVDITLPVRQVAELKLGDVEASLALEINCSDPNIERKIDERQRRAFDAFLNQGATKIKSRIEMLVSSIKVQAAVPGVTPFQINQLLVSVFPEIMLRLREVLLHATQEPNLSFLIIHVDETLNFSAQIDRLVAQDQRDRMDIFKAIATPTLTTPYHPEEELEIRFEHYKKLMERWPSSLTPTISDFNAMVRFIDYQHSVLSQELYLEKPRPGLFGRLFGVF